MKYLGYIMGILAVNVCYTPMAHEPIVASIITLFFVLSVFLLASDDI